jgi:large subunit ribosomal protein L2
MGKRIISQRRGAPKTRYQAPSHRYLAEAKHHNITTSANRDEVAFGTVVDLVHSVSHTAPLAKIKYEDGTEGYIQAAEKMAIGDVIATGNNATATGGNTLPLMNIPEGTSVYNIESKPGDGGKFVRASGTQAKIAAKVGNKVVIRFPSKKQREFDGNCRATIGVVAGGGRLEKPWVKAGNRYHALRAKGKLYPIVSAVAMNANEHPFGSGRGRHMGKPSISPRFAPPGRKVGQVGARRMGRKR